MNFKEIVGIIVFMFGLGLFHGFDSGTAWWFYAIAGVCIFAGLELFISAKIEKK